MKKRDYLFSKTDANGVIRAWKEKMTTAVDSLEQNYALNVNEEEYIKHIVSEYYVEPPNVHLDKKTIHTGDSEIDVSGRHDYATFHTSGPVNVKGTSFTISIPFDGRADLFDLKLPSTYYDCPMGSVRGNEIQLNYSRLPQDQSQLKEEIERDCQRIERCAKELVDIIEKYNSGLEDLARQALAKRREKISGDLKLVESLEIPLKRTDETAETFTVPLKRSKIEIKKPKVEKGGYSPDPTMLPDDYESILEIIKHLSLVIERNPDTFGQMKEPDIRNIILVLLNAVFLGTATGETFNAHGKTDILLRHEGQNLFIAECKFWSSKGELTKAINQLIRYVTWRDTKTALIIFNRKGNLTNILSQIQEVVKSHACYKGEIPQEDETTFRYRFCHPDDKNREFLITVPVFEVPSKKT